MTRSSDTGTVYLRSRKIVTPCLLGQRMPRLCRGRRCRCPRCPTMLMRRRRFEVSCAEGQRIFEQQSPPQRANQPEVAVWHRCLPAPELQTRIAGNVAMSGQNKATSQLLVINVAAAGSASRGVHCKRMHFPRTLDPDRA